MTGGSSREDRAADGSGGSLSGADVVLLRSPDRAGPMTRELRSRGARVQLMPLIDFQRPADTEPVSAALRRLGAGDFSWIIFTSATTVGALSRAAEELGGTLPGLCSGTRVAAVGKGTARALEAAGLSTDLLPGADQSARGLAAAWPARGDGANRVFLPQANIADPFLRTALAASGWDVCTVAAYETVDYPAPEDRRISAEPEGDQELLSPSRYRAGAAFPHAVVVTSPSTARRFVRDALVPGTAVLAAIGDPTAAELRGLGHPAAATAEHPTPAGIAGAVEAALATIDFPHPDPEGREQP